ncbi:hypothetical protein SteCoe_8920 [Stentor coeruleus]|uniref:Phosphodiesterase n=1 Tax=Stentor coeruleus TaxID=5963 RepID=A0A1R2CJ73_9CILI|nr:hypothetical protein SteCoe_8920 [Stentor coeruleus]
MKVIPYPTSVTVENMNMKINYFTLGFLNQKINEDYIKYIVKKPKTNCDRYIKTIIQVFHCMILLVYTGNYLSKLDQEGFSDSLIFQFAFIIPVIIIAQYMLYIGINANKGYHKSSYYVTFSYLCSSVTLILNDSFTQNLIFKNSGESNLSCLPGLILLSFIYLHAMANCYFQLTLFNLVLIILFGVLRFTNRTSITLPILEILLLLFAHIAQICLVYAFTLENMQEFFTKKLREECEPEKLLDQGDNVVNNYKVNECIEELYNVLPTAQENLKLPIEKTIGLLNNLTCDSRERIIVEKSIFEEISNNLDVEDKMYIEQSWCNNQTLKIRKTEKCTVKRFFDKNLDKYFEVDVAHILKQVSVNWNFDTFDLNHKTGLKPLSTLGKYCLKLYNLIETFNFLECKVDKFLTKLEKSYKQNPYHNAVHGADILTSSLFFINNSFLSACLSEIDILAVIISHLAHDVGHPGFTNRFLVTFQDRLALQYNDISVLESMHCSILFSLLAEDDKSILTTLDRDQYILFRKMTIDIILATDMGKHFDLLGLFRIKNYSPKTMESFESKMEVLKMLIKTSDIGHAAKSNEIHTNWSMLITEEFFKQGDLEKERKKTVSMYCDRETTIIAKSQIGFLKNIALPLYEALNRSLNSGKIETMCVEQIKNNISTWEYRFKNDASRTLKDNQLGLISKSPSTISLMGIKSRSDAVLSKHK